jgi:hypothetical protein
MGVFTFIFELLDFIGHFHAFWAFIFSRKFRKTTISSWRKERWYGKLGMALDGFMASLVGLFPMWLLLAVWHNG